MIVVEQAEEPKADDVRSLESAFIDALLSSAARCEPAAAKVAAIVFRRFGHIERARRPP